MLRSTALAVALAVAACAHVAPGYDAEEKSIVELQADLRAGVTTSEQLVAAYLARIDAIDVGGPALNSVLTLNPDALSDARALDAERREGVVRGPLHGVPILIKDNIETADPMATTAGSLALADNVTNRDATAVARLREVGAIILGKTNLSEWANFRSSESVSGWSALGGFTRNPHALDRNPCGSSSGSGAAAAASLAAAAIGTETNGSVTCPASMNGIVGVKPTVGLVSRVGVIPISASQDTAGPMARTVADAAILLAAMAGSDRADPATADADAHATDYLAALDAGALDGARIGAARFAAGYHAGTDALFEAALEALAAQGAEIVELAEGPEMGPIFETSYAVLLSEFKDGVEDYLAGAAPEVEARTLADLIAFNEATPAELAWFGQDIFAAAEATAGLDDPAYLAAREEARRRAGPEGLDRILAAHDLDAIVAPTNSPAWRSDAVLGDVFLGSASTLPAVAGYPHVTVPMGAVRGLPVGLSFIGPAWSEARLLAMAYAYEQATRARGRPAYSGSSAFGAEIE